MVVNCGAETDEEKCCRCLTLNKCTDSSEERCLDIFYVVNNKDSISVDIECIGRNDCYFSCAAGGAYFEDGKMVVDYWKKRNFD